MKNLVLIGFMGTGKSTLGKAAASFFQTEFVDMDLYIEAKEGRSIPDIFAENGEAFFRDCERKAVKELAKREGIVIATGGGTVKNPDNVKDLRQNGVIVLLKADVDTILARTEKRGERPVLDGKDKGDRRKAIEQLLEERKCFYAGADIEIDTGVTSVADALKIFAGILKGE